MHALPRRRRAVAVEVDAREVDQPGTDDEELRSPYVTEGELDLAAWAHDALALALPQQLLCRPDAPGLCPVCGESLNDADPGAHDHPREPDPRWAKLRELQSSVRFDASPATIPRRRWPSRRREPPRSAATSAAPRTRAAKPRLNECPRCHSPRLPHRVCPVCGTYAGREVIAHEIGEADSELRAPPGRRAADDHRRPRRPRAPSGGPRRSSPAPAPRPPTGSGCACSATRPSSRQLERRRRGRAGRGPRRDHQRRRPGRRGPRHPAGLDRARRRRRRRGHARDALASAGPTGATMTAALFALRRMHGVRRPGARACSSPCPAAIGPPTPAARRRRQHRGRAPPTWSSSPTWAPPSARRCSGSSARGWRCSRSARSRRRAPPEVVEAHAELAAARGDRLPRQRRGPRPARRRGRRDRHRRVHRQRRAEDDRGHREDGRRRGRRRRRARTRSPRSAACCCARRSAACAGGWTPTRPAARSCSACAASPWSATAAPARRGSPTRSGSRRARSRSTRSSGPRSCSSPLGSDPGRDA